jgi:phospholipase C
MKNFSVLTLIIFYLLGPMAPCLSFENKERVSSKDKASLDQIHTVVILYLENRSFDNLFGFFPQSEGIAQAMLAPPQRDREGEIYQTLPQFEDSRLPKDIPNHPFLLDQFIGMKDKFASPVHSFYTQQKQIHGGLNDHFVSEGKSGALPMGYHDGRQTKLWHWAERYTLADHFFQAAFGGSFLNHHWLICACTPPFPNPPSTLIAHETVTPDGYAVNTIESVQFHQALKNPENLLPSLDLPTIGDRLTQAKVDWTWYAGGYQAALENHPDPLFQYHHQPFVYYRQFSPGSAEAQQHLRDESEF